MAPYGQGDIDNLCSIFEMPHLRTNAVFLDTQCNSIVSFTCVYDSDSLICRSYARSHWSIYLARGVQQPIEDHSHHLYNQELRICRCFYRQGGEERIQLDGEIVCHFKITHRLSSCQNYREIQVAMSLARKYHNLGKSYRLITPYDAQRSQLESALQAEKLPWEDRCFNVDSFQGTTSCIRLE